MPYTNSYPKSLHLPASHKRHTVSRRAPLTDSQRKERSAASQKRQDEIDEAVCDWKANTLTLAMDLAHHFNKKHRYFLNLFFQGGIHLVHKQTKVNPHNAFLSMKAQELHDSALFPSRCSVFLLMTINWLQMVIPPHWPSSIPRNSRRSTRSLMRPNEPRSLPLMNPVAMIISAQQLGPEFKTLQQCCKPSVTWYRVFFFFFT